MSKIKKNKLFIILMDEVINNSKSNIWEEAKNEWNVVDHYDLDNNSCACTHSIVETFVIKNIYNNNTLEIGNVCIKQFRIKRMDQEMEKIMRGYCNLCNREYCNILKHYKTEKHLKKVEEKKTIIKGHCDICNCKNEYDDILQHHKSDIHLKNVEDDEKNPNKKYCIDCGDRMNDSVSWKIRCFNCYMMKIY